MDLVRKGDVMSCVRILFCSVAEGYVITTDLQGFIPESYLSLLTLMTGGWEQNSWHLQYTILLLLPSFFLLILGWVFFAVVVWVFLITHYTIYLAMQARLDFRSHPFLSVL